MLLKIERVVAGYDGSDILKGVKLMVEPRSITCIVGPNGAGKSTLLRVISGLLKPRHGTITFDGHSIGGLPPRQILDLGIVQVPQNHSLFKDMTVRENVRPVQVQETNCVRDANDSHLKECARCCEK